MGHISRVGLLLLLGHCWLMRSKSKMNEESSETGGLTKRIICILLCQQ